VELSSNPSDLRLRARARDLFASRLNHTVVDQALKQDGVRLWVAATVNNVHTVRTLRCGERSGHIGRHVHTCILRAIKLLQCRVYCAQRTIFAQAGAALAWRARGDGAVEVLLLAAGRQDRGLGTMLAEALFEQHAPAPALVLLFASEQAVDYWHRRWGLVQHRKGAAMPCGAQGMYNPCTCTLMYGAPVLTRN